MMAPTVEEVVAVDNIAFAGEDSLGVCLVGLGHEGECNFHIGPQEYSNS